MEREIQNPSALLNANSPLAKQELHKHLSSITMHPVGDGGERHYEAQDSWSLLSRDKNAPREEHAAQDSDEGRLRLVAGECTFALGNQFFPPWLGLLVVWPN